MAEVEFERRLERLFAESPEFADAGSFAERVERRLDAGWTARRWLIGAAGVIGGVIGASQLMVSNIFQRVEAASDSARLLSTGLNHISSGTDWWAAVSTGGATVWITAGLAVVMMGFVLTRVIGEI
ncbi:MAG: hypothetical protein ACJ798_05910 [Phenylobacterium sp.]